MWCKVTCKNYRCFPDSSPLVFDLRPGICAFVGVNNSGKSSILKFFYEMRHLWGSLSTMLNIIEPLNHRVTGTSINGVADSKEIFFNGNNRDIVITFEPVAEQGELKPEFVVDRLEVTLKRESSGFILDVWLNGTKLSPQAILAPDTDDRDLLVLNGQRTANFRSLFQFFFSLREMFYVGPFRNALNLDGTAPYYDLDVAKRFIQKWGGYHTGSEKAKNELIQSVVDNLKKIFGYEALQIQATFDRESFQTFADGRSYKLAEIGSGLTQFIIVLGNVAMARPSYILIDEPELNLHPSLQLDFLTTLASFSGGNLLFATHTIGLARAASERIYALSHVKGISRINPLERAANLSEFLGELSYGSYTAMGFDKVLLVEGVNDVKTIQQFLRQLGKDHQVVLLPLGGNAFFASDRAGELSELTRITGNAKKLYAMIDSEKDSEGTDVSSERQKFVETCKKLGMHVHVLNRRAIENYLTDRAVKEVFGPKSRMLSPFERPENLESFWGKNRSWLAARHMNFSEIEATDLGKFLKEL